MTFKFNKQRGRWYIDIDDFVHPDGRKEPRIRKMSPVNSEAGAKRHEREIRNALQAGTYGRFAANVPVPSVEAFEPDFIQKYEGDKNKPTGIENYKSLFRAHLIPLFGGRLVNSFGKKDERVLKARFKELSESRYNNAASAMNGLIALWHEENELPGKPYRFPRINFEDPIKPFYEFDKAEALIRAATSTGIVMQYGLAAELTALLGMHAGLRRGEIWGLTPKHCRMRERQLIVEMSETLSGKKRFMGKTKGERTRIVPMTRSLHAALGVALDYDRERIVCKPDGKPFNQGTMARMMKAIQKAAGLEPTGNVHILRHTFCSHLAIRGVPVLTIQKLAGHAQLTTTLGYMRLAVGDTQSAIDRLEEAPPR